MKFFKQVSFVILLSLVAFLTANAQETGGAKGKIKNAQDRGIAGVEVTVEHDGKPVKKASTDKSGSFTVDGLKSGKYNFVFSKTGFATGTLNNVEVGGKKVRDLGNRLLEVDEGMLVLIKGTVFNQDGKSLSDAKVTIERISGGDKLKVKPVYTSESGDFTFRFPESAAKYRVTATAKGKSVSKEVETEGAAIYRLALTLEVEK